MAKNLGKHFIADEDFFVLPDGYQQFFAVFDVDAKVTRLGQRRSMLTSYVTNQQRGINVGTLVFLHNLNSYNYETKSFFCPQFIVGFLPKIFFLKQKIKMEEKNLNQLTRVVIVSYCHNQI